MDGYESTRREFLKKLGLLVSATAVAASGASGVATVIADDKEKYVLTQEQELFMQKYEIWLEKFHEMAKFQKIDSENIENNKRLVSLSEEAKKWQHELIEFMKDQNFARYYMITTERVTTVI